MAKHWYRIDMRDGERSRALIGSSELTPIQLVKQLSVGEYLVLNDLSYRDNQNRIVSWSTWDPRLGPVAYINPQYVTTVIPFVSDPRSASGDMP